MSLRPSKKARPDDAPPTVRLQSFQNPDEDGDLFMAPDATELFLRDEQTGTDPAFTLIATVPAFDVTTNGLDDGER